MNVLTFDIEEWYIEQQSTIGKEVALNDDIKWKKMPVVKF